MDEKPEPDNIEIYKETWKEFEEYRKWKDGRRAEQPEAKAPKPKKWRCDTCGRDLGPADWDAAKLSRMHPDGCPNCGSTKAAVA